MLLCAPSGPRSVARSDRAGGVAARPAGGRRHLRADRGGGDCQLGLCERLPFARAVLEDSAPFACDMGERLVALRGEAVVGLVDFVRSTGWIPYLFVLPGVQGQGVGGTLLGAPRPCSPARPRLPCPRPTSVRSPGTCAAATARWAPGPERLAWRAGGLDPAGQAGQAPPGLMRAGPAAMHGGLPLGRGVRLVGQVRVESLPSRPLGRCERERGWFGSGWMSP